MKAISKKVMANLDDIITGYNENNFLKDALNNPNIINQYIDRITESGLPEDCILCIHPNRATSHKYISGLWVEILKIMRDTGYDVPSGVILKNNKWHVNITLFIPCGTCQLPLSRRCQCFQDNISG